MNQNPTIAYLAIVQVESQGRQVEATLGGWARMAISTMLIESRCNGTWNLIRIQAGDGQQQNHKYGNTLLHDQLQENREDP
jgi:hypothetical protein